MQITNVYMRSGKTIRVDSEPVCTSSGIILPHYFVRGKRITTRLQLVRSIDKINSGSQRAKFGENVGKLVS